MHASERQSVFGSLLEARFETLANADRCAALAFLASLASLALTGLLEPAAGSWRLKLWSHGDGRGNSSSPPLAPLALTGLLEPAAGEIRIFRGEVPVRLRTKNARI
jgi:hypothetical protein